MDYIAGTTKIEGVDAHLRTRQQLTSLLRQNLVAAIDRMKLYSDRHRTERSFSVGDWVFLRLQPYKQKSLKHHQLKKLAPKFYGPFQILQKVGEVSYKLDLPPNSKIHPTFHVSCLKAKLGQHVVLVPTLPPTDMEGAVITEPVAVLQERSHQLRNKTITQVLEIGRAHV